MIGTTNVSDTLQFRQKASYESNFVSSSKM